jgi:hypothetical protein
MRREEAELPAKFALIRRQFENHGGFGFDPAFGGKKQAPAAGLYFG